MSRVRDWEKILTHLTSDKGYSEYIKSTQNSSSIGVIFGGYENFYILDHGEGPTILLLNVKH